MEPSFIVCDEAVSALDVSIQGQIINLLEDLQHRLGLAYLFIAHDLAVVRHISMRVVVMYFGRVMEIADRDELYRNPLHPYTKALLDAAPIPDPTVEKARAPPLIRGELPSHLTPPTGCVFNTRCPVASAECHATIPPLEKKRPGHYAACIKI
jgi:peptide/nickel transport system ATP-binding protein